MAGLTISEVAQQVGLNASAIRYYERIELLPKPQRLSGQRRYDSTSVNRLGLLQRARSLGFTLDEIRHLFSSFANKAPASERWRSLGAAKLAELDAAILELDILRGLVTRMMENCNCASLDECGKRILRCGSTPSIPSPRALTRRL